MNPFFMFDTPDSLLQKCLLLKGRNILPTLNIRIISYSLLVTMNKATVLMASILAVATALAAGLVVLTLPLQDADAETPCNVFPTDIDADEISNNCDFYGNTEIDASSSGGLIGIPRLGGGANPCNIDTLDIDAEEVENNCDFYGNTKIDASSELPIRPCDPLDPLCNRLGLGQLTEIPSDEDEDEDEDEDD
jgi:hypothetical protein